MWSKGFINGENGRRYEYQVKHFDEGSEFGINEGKISKLWISLDGKTVCSYDRGWDVFPEDGDIKNVYNKLLDRFN